LFGGGVSGGGDGGGGGIVDYAIDFDNAACLKITSIIPSTIRTCIKMFIILFKLTKTIIKFSRVPIEFSPLTHFQMPSVFWSV